MSRGPALNSAHCLLFEEVWLEGRLSQHLDAVYRDQPSRAVLDGLDGAPALTYTKLAVARAAGRVSRARGRGGGSAAPGRLLLRMAPGAMRTLAQRLEHGVVLVSATNGKTTTARMLASILAAEGHTVVHNREGANTNWGVVTALAERDGDVGVFEVDEAWLPLLAEELRPRLVILGNLSRDRLDAYGELEMLVSLWRDLVQGSAAPTTLVANADDPLLVGPGGVLDGASVQSLLFGVNDENVGTVSPDHPHEAHSCARCGHPLDYTRAFAGHVGHYRCPQCRRSRPAPTVRATAVSEHGLEGTTVAISLAGDSFKVRLAQPGLHNVHNALAATAAAVALGVGRKAIQSGLQTVLPPFGRSETIPVKGRSVHLCLVKNPAGVNATFRVLRADNRMHPLHLWLALNDGYADGRDVSWIWDADFETLAGVVTAATCSGHRAHELAVRLKYAGWSCQVDVDRRLDESFGAALRRAPSTLVALPTYSALLDLRGVLNRLGVAVSDWGVTARAAPWSAAFAGP